MLRPDSIIDHARASKKRRLADELAFAARSVNYAMRLGVPNILITAAEAIESLAKIIPKTQDELVKLRGF